MKKFTKIMSEWETMLSIMVDTFRHNNPHNPITDYELLTLIHEALCKKGLIKKSKNGKYLIPKIINWNSPSNPFLS